jgi:hypothetical protein
MFILLRQRCQTMNSKQDLNLRRCYTVSGPILGPDSSKDFILHIQLTLYFPPPFVINLVPGTYPRLTVKASDLIS